MRPTIVRLDDPLSLRARTHENHPAIVAGGRVASYAELDAEAAAVARRLAALGVGAGSRVATTLPAGLHFAALLHGVARVGAALVPVNTRLTRAASAWGLGVSPDDRWLCVLPVFHVGGLAILMRSAVYGTAAVVHERFDADAAAAAIAGSEVTLASLVPTMLLRMAEAGLESGPGLRAVLLGGASAPSELVRSAVARGLPVVRTYGMTETASQIAVEPVGERGVRPLPGVELRIGRGGEVLVRGPMVARGSLAGDGWLHTGDSGQIDDRGLLHVEGRLDEVIVTGGEKVAAAEVEDALLAHPAVRDAGVVGAPDPEWGEAVTAFVVTSEAVREEGLLDHCRRRVARYKVPKRVVLVDSLPRNAAGKLRRDALAAPLPARGDQ